MLAVIGNDAIQVEDKYSKAFSAVIHGKAVLGSNGLPTMPDDTGAVSRRLLVTQRHSRPDGALPDPYLSKRLASELPGILHWACDGLQRLLARGRFDSARLDAELQDHAAAASNQIYAWGRESIEIIKPVTSEDRSVFTPTSVLFDDYRMWCEGQNIRNTKTMNDFVVSMKQTYGSRIKADRGMHEGKQVRGFLYVRLRPDETEDEEQVTLPAARVRKPVVLP
jgi:putative DNA primase/helicase